MRIVACLALVVASAALRVAEDVALPQSSALDIDGDSDVDVLAVRVHARRVTPICAQSHNQNR